MPGSRITVINESHKELYEGVGKIAVAVHLQQKLIQSRIYILVNSN